MSNAMTSHPEPEQLLRYADGELGGAARNEVFEHLAECGECRIWLSDLESGVVDYSRSWMPLLRETAAAPPAQWFDLRRRMTDIDQTPAPAAQSARFRPRWVAIAAAVLFTVGATYWFSGQRVTAAELLRKAAERETAAERSRPAIRISGRSGSIVRLALWRGAALGQADSLRMRFVAAHYSWEDPLSARSFSAWRESLSNRQDQVIKVRGADGSSSYEISTQSASGALVEVRMALRVSDLHATRSTLRFRDNELVEITEMPGTLPDPARPPALVAESPRASSQESSAPEGPITPGEELRVWAALRRIDADLGEPIEVERDSSANVIVVTALGLSADRRRILENAVSGLQRVQLRFRDPQPVRESSRSLRSEPANPPPLQPKLESQLGSRTLAEEFTDRILEASESALVRAHAIRELARRFPVETESQLSPDDHALLNSLLWEHFAGLHGASQQVLLEARQITAPAVSAPQLSARSWQAHAQSLVAAVERVDQALTKLLAVGSGATGQQALITELDGDLSRMQAENAAAEPAFRRTR